MAVQGTTTGLEISADGPWAVAVVGLIFAVDDANVARSYHGTGDSVIVFPIDDENVQSVTAFDRATLTHEGSRNFIARELLGGGLVNEIGAYQGTVRLSSDGVFGFEITADGPWTLTLQ